MPKISGLTLALRRIPSAAYLYGVLAVAVFGAYQGWAYHQREVGKRDLLIAQAEQENATLRAREDSLAKAYRVDTLRLWRTVRALDTLTVSVDHWKTDTLKVVEYVGKADSTVKACTLALGTCEQRVAVAQKGWDNARREIATLKASFPSKLSPWRHGAIGAILGAGAVLLIK